MGWISFSVTQSRKTAIGVVLERAVVEGQYGRSILKSGSFGYLFKLESLAMAKIRLRDASACRKASATRLGVSALPSTNAAFKKAARAPRELSVRDSCEAVAFVCFYLTVYLAVGWALVAAIEWAWRKLFS
jgi:hypothetical protein